MNRKIRRTANRAARRTATVLSSRSHAPHGNAGRTFRVLRYIIFTAFAATCAWIPSPAAAGDDSRVDRLIELLVNKQIISSEEAGALLKEISTPEKPAKTAETKPPTINLKGYIRLRGEWTDNGAAATYDAFRVRQARMDLSGEPAPRVSYKMGLLLEATAPVVLDGFITYKLNRKTSLTAGQFKIPMSRESLQSGKDIDLLERAWFLDQFRNPNARDIGFKAAHKPSADTLLEIGVFNGSGKNTPSTNDQPLWAARASAAFSARRLRLEPEIAWLHAPTENGSPAPLDIALGKTSGFSPYDKQLKHLGLAAFWNDYSLKYEYLQGRFRPRGETVATAISDGMYLQLGKALTDRITAMLRFETYDYNLRTSTSDTEWTTLALTLRENENLSYKLNHTWKKEAAGSDDNDRFGLEVTLGF